MEISSCARRIKRLKCNRGYMEKIDNNLNDLCEMLLRLRSAGGSMNIESGGR